MSTQADRSLAQATQRDAIRRLADAIVETVNETGMTPAGPMYLAFQAQGLSLNVFNQITDVLVRIGKIRRQGDCFYPVKT